MDLTDVLQLRRLLRSHGLSADKDFGQHFLVDRKVLESIVHSARLGADDLVVEVGPGPGVLTAELAGKVKKVLAVEADQRIIPCLKEMLGQFTHVDIIHSDVLKWSPPSGAYSLVANLPYAITSPVFRHFLLDARIRPVRMVVLIQREVAERICSLEHPTLLSWEVRIFGEPKIVCIVPARSFYPPPKVESAVLSVEVFERPLVERERRDNFFRLLGMGFRQPRKTLLNNLKMLGLTREVLKGLELSETVRAHELKLEDWKRLEKVLGADEGTKGVVLVNEAPSRGRVGSVGRIGKRGERKAQRK